MYQPKQLGSLWVITKNGSIVTDEELSQKLDRDIENSFNWEAEAWEVIEEIKP